MLRPDLIYSRMHVCLPLGSSRNACDVLGRPSVVQSVQLKIPIHIINLWLILWVLSAFLLESVIYIFPTCRCVEH